MTLSASRHRLSLIVHIKYARFHGIEFVNIVTLLLFSGLPPATTLPPVPSQPLNQESSLHMNVDGRESEYYEIPEHPCPYSISNISEGYDLYDDMISVEAAIAVNLIQSEVDEDIYEDDEDLYEDPAFPSVPSMLPQPLALQSRPLPIPPSIRPPGVVLPHIVPLDTGLNSRPLPPLPQPSTLSPSNARPGFSPPVHINLEPISSSTRSENVPPPEETISSQHPKLNQGLSSTLPLPPRRQDSLPPTPRPRLFTSPQVVPKPVASPEATNDDADSSDSDDPYLAFPMDLESLDISKLTLEQLEQIDPKQAQLWMLLHMHKMVKKVEDVYESAEQLYSIYQAPPRVPTKVNQQDICNNSDESRPSESQDSQHKEVNYENTQVKRPVPLPRKLKPKSESGEESSSTDFSDSTKENNSESEPSQSNPPQDTAKVVKLYRKQKVIGELQCLLC